MPSAMSLRAWGSTLGPIAFISSSTRDWSQETRSYSLQTLAYRTRFSSNVSVCPLGFRRAAAIRTAQMAMTHVATAVTRAAVTRRFCVGSGTGSLDITDLARRSRAFSALIKTPAGPHNEVANAPARIWPFPPRFCPPCACTARRPASGWDKQSIARNYRLAGRSPRALPEPKTPEGAKPRF